MKISVILLCCLYVTGCATRPPAEGPPPGRGADRIDVGPPIYGDFEDRMPSQSDTPQAPQLEGEADWPAGPFGFNMEGLKIVGMILVVYGLMSLVQHNSSPVITGSGGGPVLPACAFVPNPLSGLNCQ